MQIEINMLLVWTFGSLNCFECRNFRFTRRLLAFTNRMNESVGIKLFFFLCVDRFKDRDANYMKKFGLSVLDVSTENHLFGQIV